MPIIVFKFKISKGTLILTTISKFHFLKIATSKIIVIGVSGFCNLL